MVFQLLLSQLEQVYVTKVQPAPFPNGYIGVQVGAFHAKPHRATKSIVSQCAKANVPPLKDFAEFQVSHNAVPALGSTVSASHYQVGQYVDVQGTTVGKGFQGVMKRYGFKGQPATHGVSVSHRSHGSTGQCQDPGRVFKGKKMAGRMGGKTRTVLNCQIVKIDYDANVLYVKGQIPGHDNGVLRVRDAVKKYGQLAGPTPTASDSKTGTEWLPKTGSDPYLAYEQA
jgi:large subunit ribosomal protein L3